MRDRFTVLMLGIVVVALGGLYVLMRQEGYIAVEMPGAEMQLKARFGGNMSVQSGSAPVAVPPHVYTPASLTLTQERDGRTWKLSSYGPWGELARIHVERNQTTRIELGPPLVLKPEVEIRHGYVYVDLGIFGRAGERYRPFVGDGIHRVRRPVMRIIDEDGTVLASRTFEYG